MSITESEKITMETYDRIAADRSREVTTNTNFWRDVYEWYMVWENKPRILDLGCGDGRDMVLHNDVFETLDNYCGIDLSLEMLKSAKSRDLVDHEKVKSNIIPGEPLVRGNMYNLPFKDGSFNIVWAVASLIHVPRENIGEPLREMRRVLSDDGGAFFAMKYGDGERWEGKTEKDKRHFVYWKEDNFSKVLKDHGFQNLDCNIDNSRDNRGIPWLCVFSRKSL